MDVGGIGGASPLSSASGPLRPAATAGMMGTRTELPASASVQPVAFVQPVRLDLNEQTRAAARLDAVLRDVIDRHLEIDPKTREVVYQLTDTRTGEVIRQVPDAMLPRLRAYVRATPTLAPDSDSPRVAKIA